MGLRIAGSVLLRGERYAPESVQARSEPGWKPRAEKEDYKGSGFDRGHMTASADRLSTQALNDQTFYLSNMVPQNGSLNSGFWSRLEDAVRGFSETGLVTEAKAVTGGFFYDPAEENPSTADGLVPFDQIGTGAVAVPTHPQSGEGRSRNSFALRRCRSPGSISSPQRRSNDDDSGIGTKTSPS